MNSGIPKPNIPVPETGGEPIELNAPLVFEDKRGYISRIIEAIFSYIEKLEYRETLLYFAYYDLRYMTTFEFRSQKLHMGILADNTEGAKILMYFLRLITDGRFQHILDLLYTYIRRNKDATLRGFISELSHESIRYFGLSARFYVDDKEVIISRIDLWTLPRIKRKMAEIYGISIGDVFNEP
jgi:hypothetical protein